MGRTISSSVFARRLLSRLCSVSSNGIAVPAPAPSVQAIPPLIVAIFLLVATMGASRLPGGFEWQGGLGTLFGLMGVVWLLTFFTQLVQPSSRLATLLGSLVAFFALSLLATLTSAALALSTGSYIDAELMRIERIVCPWFDWAGWVLRLPEYPTIYRLLEDVYSSLTWQPFALFAVITFFGSIRDYARFLAGWALGLACCILPFPWLAAKGPYEVLGIEQADMPGSRVSLPWDYPRMLEFLRAGEAEAIGLDTMSGLVTMPSFHACGAALLAANFWRFRSLRWPMTGLNLTMALAAIPIGGHYVPDIIVGGAIGLLLHRLVLLLDSRHDPALTRTKRNPEQGSQAMCSAP